MKRLATAFCVPLLLLGLAACGDDQDPGSASSDDSVTDEMSDRMDDMDMDDMDMGDPDATPADEVEGERTSGSFVVLDTAPPGSDGVAGEAFLAQNDDGTTVTVRLSGLEPDTEYVGHLHAQPCDEDSGGPHFQFEQGGSEEPPNEIHLGFTSDADGEGEATATNDRRVEDGAPSVVIHPADSVDNRLACADFS